LNTSAARDFGFCNQIQRCGVSVVNNIAEGFKQKTDMDSARFLDIAKASNGEVRSMPYPAGDRAFSLAKPPNQCASLAKTSVVPSNP
jgi:four helix bundle protein